MPSMNLSPQQRESFQQKLSVFAGASRSLECIHAHFFPDRKGQCDLTNSKDEEEIYVFKNTAQQTIKLGPQGVLVLANILDMVGYKTQFEKMKQLKKEHKNKLLEQEQALEEKRKSSSKKVVLRKRRS